MIHTIKELFRKPSASVIAQRELEDARRDLLTAQSNREYYVHAENMLHERIKRLEAVRRAEGDVL